jgi:hypothetical protein
MTYRARLLVLVALLVASVSCGNVSSSPPDALVIADASLDTQATGDAFVVLDRNCAEIKTRLSTTTDGRFWIDPDLGGATYHAFQVWCADMSTPSPTEWLELQHVSQPSDATPAANYATYATGTSHFGWTCDCGRVTTLYSKVRLDPVSLEVIANNRFAVFAASTDQTCLAQKSGCPGAEDYAVAASCVAPNDASGTANINLLDTPFHVAGTGADVSMFTAMGYMPAGTAAIDGGRKVVELTGGGDCGAFGAFERLPLAQDM